MLCFEGESSRWLAVECSRHRRWIRRRVGFVRDPRVSFHEYVSNFRLVRAGDSVAAPAICKQTSIRVRSDHPSRSTTCKRELLTLRLPLLL